MNKTAEILLVTLRTALFGEALPMGTFADMSTEQWTELYRLARRQGVSAIVYDVVSELPEDEQPPRKVNIQWALSVEAIEKRYERQFKTSAELARMFAGRNIRTLVLKGLATSVYYPVPEHRECGDFDCFLGEGYEHGNRICEQAGAKVCCDYYKHSHIIWRGLMVENHRFCLPVRGNRGFKALERHLEKIAVGDTPQYIADTLLVLPTADFNALFLTAHSLNHFLSEGITLRHICDWALLLKQEQNNIDWTEFYDRGEQLHLTQFANALTAISVDCLGLKITNSSLICSSEFADRVLDDVLFQSDSLFNKGYPAWKSRLVQVRNRFSFNWKYHKIYRKSVVAETLRATTALFFDRNPKL
jgi:hypothetical protein